MTDTVQHRLVISLTHTHSPDNYTKLRLKAETGPVFHSPDLERVCDYSDLNLKKLSGGRPRNYRPSVSSGSASGEHKR